MLSQKQKQFLKDDLHRINLLYGSVRSGKTWISLLKWAIRCMSSLYVMIIFTECLK